MYVPGRMDLWVSPMKIAIVGIGTIGAEIAYTLMGMQSNNQIYLCEPHKPNQRRAHAECWDLLPIAKHTRNEITAFPYVYKYADYYIITSGERRRNTKQSKYSLFKKNYGIVSKIVTEIPKNKRIYIATNPPVEICEALHGNHIPLRSCTDFAREQVGDKDRINSIVLKGKGYTQFTPAYFIAQRVLNDGM